jgi:hypothetical protein
MQSLVVRELNERQDRLEAEMMEIYGATSVAAEPAKDSKAGSKEKAPADQPKAGLAGPK